MRTMNTIVFLSLPLVASFFAGCAADVKTGGGGEDALAGVNQQFIEGDGCIAATLPASGCLDYGQLKQQTWDACQQAGLQLVAISPKTDNGCNNATEGVVDYQCCPAQPAPPAPEPGTCTNGTINNGSCQSYDDLKIAAWNICKPAGFMLTDLVLDNGACGSGEAASATYQCCTPDSVPPPPPPNICDSGTIGNGSCQGYGDLKMAAYETCDQAGLVLIDMVPDPGGCPDGEAISTTYSCASSGACP